MAFSSDAGSLASRLFAEHGPAVRRYLYRVTRRIETADDLSQEVFLRVVRAAPDYEPRERERAWVFRIAQNVLRDHHRQRIRSREDAGVADAARPASQVLRADLHRALDGLPADEREAFLLGEVAGLTYVEIASLTAATVPSVRSRIYRARLALRDRLIPPSPETPDVRPGYDDDDR
jgi:RNA polymerase sigma-70 factor (ECF subfamily)